MTADIHIRAQLKKLVAPDGFADAFAVLGEPYPGTAHTCLGQLLLEKFVIDPSVLADVGWILFQFLSKHHRSEAIRKKRMFASAVSSGIADAVTARFESVGLDEWINVTTKGWFTVTNFRRNAEERLRRCRFYFVVKSGMVSSLTQLSPYAKSANACLLVPKDKKVSAFYYEAENSFHECDVTHAGIDEGLEQAKDDWVPDGLWNWLDADPAKVALYVGITHQELGDDGTSNEEIEVEPTLWVGFTKSPGGNLDSILDKLTLCEDYLVREYLPIVRERLLPSEHLDKLQQETCSIDFGHGNPSPKTEHWTAVEKFLGESINEEARAIIKPSLRGLCGKTCGAESGDYYLTLGGGLLVVLAICRDLKLFETFKPHLVTLGGFKFLPPQQQATAKATLKVLYEMCSSLIYDDKTRMSKLLTMEFAEDNFSLVLDFDPHKSSEEGHASLMQALEDHFSYAHETLRVKHLTGGRTTLEIQRFFMLARTADKQSVVAADRGFAAPAPITFAARNDKCVVTFWKSDSWLRQPRGTTLVTITTKQSQTISQGDTSLTFAAADGATNSDLMRPGIVDLSEKEGRREALRQMLGSALVWIGNQWQEQDQNGGYRFAGEVSPNVLIVHWTHRGGLPPEHPPVIYYGGDGPVPEPTANAIQGDWIHRLIGDAGDVESKLTKEALLDAFHYVMSKNEVSDRECPSLLKPGYDPAKVLKNLSLKPAT